MGKRVKRRLTRPSRKLQTRDLIIVATEGAITEKSYIEVVYKCFQAESEKRRGVKPKICIQFSSLKNQSSPKRRLSSLKKKIEESRIDDNYTAWLIFDRDAWARDQFQEVERWVESDRIRNHWILNSPNFEYWLKLHFNSQTKAKEFFERYDKRVKSTDFSYAQIVEASKKARESTLHISSLLEQDGSEMYKFVEFLAKQLNLDSGFTD